MKTKINYWKYAALVLIVVALVLVYKLGYDAGQHEFIKMLMQRI